MSQKTVMIIRKLDQMINQKQDHYILVEQELKDLRDICLSENTLRNTMQKIHNESKLY